MDIMETISEAAFLFGGLAMAAAITATGCFFFVAALAI
jgi:hypothetical protein